MELRLNTYRDIIQSNYVSENVFSQYMYKLLPMSNHLWVFKKQFMAQVTTRGLDVSRARVGVAAALSRMCPLPSCDWFPLQVYTLCPPVNGFQYVYTLPLEETSARNAGCRFQTYGRVESEIALLAWRISSRYDGLDIMEFT